MYLNYLPIQLYARNLIMSFCRKSLCKIRRRSKWMHESKIQSFIKAIFLKRKTISKKGMSPHMKI